MAKNSYVRDCLERALKEAGGDAAVAQERILRDAVTDRKLLLGLVAPHIKAIVGHALARTAKGAAGPSTPAAPAPSARLATGQPAGGGAKAARAASAKTPKRPKSLSPGDMDRVMDQLGARIGTIDTPQGLTALVTPPKRRAVNKSHAETMRQLAVAYARQRFDPTEE